ncbi:MAG: PAS domain S-box protein, partial [Methanospirillum sp.]
MNNHRMLPTLKAGGLPLALVALLTVAAFIISIVSLLSGWHTIFQNIFYLPIILACAYYTKRGFVFSILLAAGYFLLMLGFSNDPAVLTGASIRVLFFAVVAGVITYLSLIRIRTETSLRESEERYSSLFDNSYSVFLLIDPETGKIADANAAAARYYGYTHDELVSMGIYDLNRLPRETVIGNLRRAKTEGARHFLSAHYLASGEMRHVEIYSGPINLHGNSLFYSITHDITERKIAQDALQQVNRQLHLLSSITRHDILNQVTALKGYLELSEEVIDEPETLRKFIKNELQAANTIQRQITFTRDYGELGAAAPTWQNVNETIRKAMVELPVWDLHVEPDPTNPDVYA